jgi:histone deacetylase 11
MAVRLIYTPQYDIAFFGVERFHPFDSHKYSRAWRAIRRETGRKLRHRHEKPTGPIARDELLSLHAAAYLDRDLRDPSYLSRALEIPQLAKVPEWLTDWLVLRPMRWACAGTLLAARSALNGSSAVNLSGGYHHASQARGEGFSLYSDIGLAVTLLRRSGELAGDDRVLYIDLDAHQGNGVARVFNTDPRVFIFDMYNRSIYPRDREAQRRVDCNLPISSGCLERDYFQTLRTELPRFISGLCRSTLPRLAIYNAGTDVYEKDPLGNLRLTEEGVLRRDQFVINQLDNRKIPWIMLPSGGYTRESFQLIANTVNWLMK